jgi:hypothetical protein
MKSTSRTRLTALLASAAALAVSVGALPSTPAEARAAQDAPAPTVLARHLVAPLSLAVNKEGVSFVSQNFGGPILRIEPGHRTREVVSAPAAELGGLSRRGRTLTFVVTGDSTPNLARSSVKTIKDGDVQRIGNLGRAETNRNPDADAEYGFVGLDQPCADQIDTSTFGPVVHTGVIESHPYATAKIGGTTYVADAAANVVWSVADHKVKALSVLPPIPAEVTADVAGQFGLPDCTIGETFYAEPVPTDVEVGPHGRLYVTTLAGEFPDAGGIFRINPANGTTTEVFSGLFAATGLAVDRNGDMYVAMLFPGVILRIPAGGGAPQPFATVNQPAALEISDGRLYATVNVLSGLGFKQRQTQFAPRDQELRAGPAGKLVRWKL